MCGIAAIFAYHPDVPGVDEGELTAIRDHMTARGPDGAGNWFSADRRLGLGHRRLSIIDLSEAGAQPMLLPERKLAIIFNGEIYNYRALRTALEARGHIFKSTSDTEVLLHLYAEHGEAMVNELRGMYAFALWDGEKRGLFLARDPFGIKPLYVADDGKTLRVASQVKALLAGGKTGTAPDSAGHVGFFLWGHVPEPFTFYKSIRSLPAGTSLWLGEDRARREKTFCSIPESFRSAGQSQLSACSFQLSGLLRDTVAHHLIADVPVGVFLSAGLDSTTLAALASEQGGQLRTVTLGFEEFRGTVDDETALAEIVARQYGAQHQTIWVRRQDFQAETGRLFTAMDQPSTDGVNTYFVSLAAQRAGLKVALSGLGGDELFGGYPSFRDVPRAVTAFAPLRHARLLGRAVRAVSAPVLKHFTSPKYAGLLEYGGNFGGAYLLRRGMFMPWELPDLLDPDLVREGWQRLNTLSCLSVTTDSLTADRLKVSALETCWYMRNQLLRDADWAGMAHSLEIRVPLVDITLLRALLPALGSATPPTKRDLAATPRSALPAAVLNRPKTGFQVPVRDWLMGENLKSEIRDLKVETRGLRGWTREVYAHFVPEADHSHYPRSRQAQRGQPAPRSLLPAPKRILVFRIGQLGDTIVALPAMWVVRKHFPNARLTLLCDRHPGKSYVLGADLLKDAGIFDQFESYVVDESALGSSLRPLRMVNLLSKIRRARYDLVVYLAPSTRRPEQVARDRKFFALAGIHHFIGLNGFPELPRKISGQPLAPTAAESDLLLARLAADGIPVPAPGKGLLRLGLGHLEEMEVTEWLKKFTSDGGRRWLGVGPGSKMPAKRWPEERFREVVASLIASSDVWPVVLGGSEDCEMAERLLAAWGRGYNAAGALSLRGAAAALERCALFLGNDTGTMHLAAAAQTPCVAIFSAREWPGMWFPYGVEEKVFRSQIECEGCALVECVERQNECLNRISTSEVLAACEAILRAKFRSSKLEEAVHD
jgi:asparagine synthase (glutamine-hydrolysing)